jgi:hypothetical protein
MQIAGAFLWHVKRKRLLKSGSSEATKLAGADLDPVAVAVLADSLFGNFVFLRDRKRLRARDLVSDSGLFEDLC